MKIDPSGKKVYPVVMTAMMMCIIMVSIVLFRIPVPFTQGYVNLSDAMIFISVMILGYRYGAVAAGLGSLLGDLMSGFPMWAPWTLCIKAMMALAFGLIMDAGLKKNISHKGFVSIEITGMIVSGLLMTAGYYLAEGVMYGNWIVAALGIPWNIAQFSVGAALAIALNRALARTSLRNMMTYYDGTYQRREYHI